jgi:hypothetical protein
MATQPNGQWPRLDIRAYYCEEAEAVRVILNGKDDYLSIPVEGFDQGNNARLHDAIFKLVQVAFSRGYWEGSNDVRSAMDRVMTRRPYETIPLSGRSPL